VAGSHSGGHVRDSKTEVCSGRKYLTVKVEPEKLKVVTADFSTAIFSNNCGEGTKLDIVDNMIKCREKIWYVDMQKPRMIVRNIDGKDRIRVSLYPSFIVIYCKTGKTHDNLSMLLGENCMPCVMNGAFNIKGVGTTNPQGCIPWSTRKPWHTFE